jgi:hypothetical protein
LFGAELAIGIAMAVDEAQKRIDAEFEEALKDLPSEKQAELRAWRAIAREQRIYSKSCHR